MKTALVILMMTVFSRRAFSQALFPGDIVINEILFNPPKDGYDYVEGYNNTSRPIGLGGLKIANRNAGREITNEKQITHDSLWVPPEGYFVITGNENWLRQHYHVPAEAIVCQVASMPSLPDDEGTVVLLNSKDSVLDEFSYTEKWHFPLITDPSGVALERIDFALPAQNKNNWASASSSSGYGTPGYQNSEFHDRLHGDGQIVVPRSFSPDNDGTGDLAMIQYTMKEPGFVVNTVVYDISGRKVRHLVKNETIGMFAQYKWDGLDEKSNPLPQGIYIVASDMFNLAGKVKRWRNAIVLARR